VDIETERAGKILEDGSIDLSVTHLGRVKSYF